MLFACPFFFAQYDAGGGNYKALLQPRNVLTPASVSWSTLVGHIYVGSDLKSAKLDGPENCNFLINKAKGKFVKIYWNNVNYLYFQK